MEHKSKFNKQKCVTCKYHGKASTADGTGNKNLNGVHCYYANTGETCLRRVGNKVIDIRGEDFNNCKLYERGKKCKTTKLVL